MVRVRFAPSPTGYLHLGNIRSALFNYLFAKRQGGKFILRIEDTDRERSRPEYEEALVKALLWLRLRPDEGPEWGGEFGPYRQSERLEVYKQSVQKLVDEEKAYECYVTEEEIHRMREKARAEKRSLHFDNRGRNFSEEEIEARRKQGVRPTIRFKIENPKLEFHDLVYGQVRVNLDEMVGDFVIQRADGMPTFHLAVCVDDALMKITHVIRGEDHLSNTPKHILLFEALEYSVPQFAHLPLVLGPGGEPLSKRLESVSVRAFQQKGYLPEALANAIALLGWSSGDDREFYKWEELQQVFDLERVGKSPSSYDPQKLDWLNGEHLRSLSDQDFSERGVKYLREQGLLRFDEELVKQTLPIFKDNIEKLEQLADRLEIFRDDFTFEEEDLIKSSPSRHIFQTALKILPTLQDGSNLYHDFVQALKPKVSVKGKHLFHPLRIALTGKVQGPELKRIVPVLGRDRIKRRLERALNL